MEKLLDINDLSKALGVKVSTIYSWTHEKKIPRVPGLRLLRFRESEVMDWLYNRSQKAQDKPSKVETRHKPIKSSSVVRRVEMIVEQAKKEVLS